MDRPYTITLEAEFAHQPADPPRSAPQRALRFAGRTTQMLAIGDDAATTITLGLGEEDRFGPHEAAIALRRLHELDFSEAVVDCNSLFATFAHALGAESATRVVSRELAALAISAGRPPGASQHDWRIGGLLAEAQEAARSWTNAPASALPPPAFVAEARAVAAVHDLHVEVIDGSELLDQGFGLIAAVGAGSRHDPALIDLRYQPTDPVARICLIGKGVTFDTGGLSLKQPADMYAMRMDKAGAAIVLGVMKVLGRMDCRVAVRALLPVVENMVGPDAVRPGDVALARNGQPVRIVDTDFEGRLILADALAYAAEEPVDAVIDLATLTHQIVVALGPEVAGLFSNSDPLADAVTRAANLAGEPIWRMPLYHHYESQVSEGRHLKNHPETDTGRAITAALFLEKFVAGLPWAHLDISGPAWSGPTSGEGATGFAVQTLLKLLEEGDLAAAVDRSGARSSSKRDANSMAARNDRR